MGTNGFQMEISGISDESNRPLITQSRKDSRYVVYRGRNCKGFVQVRCGLCAGYAGATSKLTSLQRPGWLPDGTRGHAPPVPQHPHAGTAGVVPRAQAILADERGRRTAGLLRPPAGQTTAHFTRATTGNAMGAKSDRSGLHSHCGGKQGGVVPKHVQIGRRRSARR
jgi:hypothetical protein